MTADDWTPVASADEIAGPPWPCAEVDGTPVQLLRDATGRIHAIRGVCPHLGAPMNQAVVDDDTVACNRHWYTYRLSDGANVAPGSDREGIEVWDVRVDAGQVEVRRRRGAPERGGSA